MKRRFNNVLIGSFAVLFLLLLGGFNANKPRIVVLHSFDQNDSWVSDIDAGINQVLAKNRRPISVQWYYMGMENKPLLNQQNTAAIDAKRFIDLEDPDILIAIDDESSALVARDYVGRDRPKILFVSIDQAPEKYGYTGAKNVSGIAEIMPLAAIKDALQAIWPKQPLRIAALGTQSVTGLAELKQVNSFDWKPHRLATAQTVGDFGQWQTAVNASAAQADVLLVLNDEGMVRSTTEAQIVAGNEVTQWTQANSKPLPVGMHSSFVVDGGGLMFSPSSTDYGQKSMQLALEWLDAPANAPPPPVLTSAHFHVGIRAVPLQARGIKLPPIYVEAARIGKSYFKTP